MGIIRRYGCAGTLVLGLATIAGGYTGCQAKHAVSNIVSTFRDDAPASERSSSIDDVAQSASDSHPYAFGKYAGGALALCLLVKAAKLRERSLMYKRTGNWSSQVEE